MDVGIKSLDPSKNGYEAQLSGGYIISHVNFDDKKIFLGTPYQYCIIDGEQIRESSYEDTDALVSTIIHETIHLILSKKIDLVSDWGDREDYFATSGFDRICNDVGL